MLRIGRLYWPRVSLVPLLHLLACLLFAARASAQVLPTEPVSVAGGRVVFGGEVFVTFGKKDPGWFNYTDYEYNALRNIRLSLATEVRAIATAPAARRSAAGSRPAFLGVRAVRTDTAVAGSAIRRADWARAARPSGRSAGPSTRTTTR